MKKDEYIKKGIVLEGHGRIPLLELDEAFFESMEAINGEIEEILEITISQGGIVVPFGSGAIEGCIIIFMNGAVICAETDREYVDLFGGSPKA